MTFPPGAAHTRHGCLPSKFPTSTQPGWMSNPSLNVNAVDNCELIPKADANTNQPVRSPSRCWIQTQPRSISLSLSLYLSISRTSFCGILFLFAVCWLVGKKEKKKTAIAATKKKKKISSEGQTRVELVIFGLQDRRLNQLGHRPATLCWGAKICTIETFTQAPQTNKTTQLRSTCCFPCFLVLPQINPKQTEKEREEEGMPSRRQRKLRAAEGSRQGSEVSVATLFIRNLAFS